MHGLRGDSPVRHGRESRDSAMLLPAIRVRLFASGLTSLRLGGCRICGLHEGKTREHQRVLFRHEEHVHGSRMDRLYATGGTPLGHSAVLDSRGTMQCTTPWFFMKFLASLAVGNGCPQSWWCWRTWSLLVEMLGPLWSVSRV